MLTVALGTEAPLSETRRFLTTLVSGSWREVWGGFGVTTLPLPLPFCSLLAFGLELALDDDEDELSEDESESESEDDDEDDDDEDSSPEDSSAFLLFAEPVFLSCFF